MTYAATRTRRTPLLWAALTTFLAVAASLGATAGTAHADVADTVRIVFENGNCLTETGQNPATRFGVVEVTPCGAAGSTWKMSTTDQDRTDSVRFVNAASGQPLALNRFGQPEVVTGGDGTSQWAIDRARVDNGQSTFLNGRGTGLFLTAESSTPVTKFTSVDSAPKVWTLVRLG
jgi:hypothetical protein